MSGQKRALASVAAAFVIGVATTSSVPGVRAAAVRPVAAGTDCSLGSLNGRYAYYRLGDNVVPAGPGPNAPTKLEPVAAAGIATFDGRGGVQSFQFVNRGQGIETSQPPTQAGRYSVNAACQIALYNTTTVVVGQRPFAYGVVAGDGYYLVSASGAVVVVARKW